jgi:membrane fusion protein, copper/silver efflux system
MSEKRGARPPAWLAVQVLLVRFRFLILLAGALLVVGYWPTLRNRWDRLTGPGGEAEGAVSLDTEYWCPMCPGVLSDWPGKCPVCNMALVRRKKGEAVPLPDGVLARMQFSPYRVQLAGIRTAPVEYRPLLREVVLVGFVGSHDSAAAGGPAPGAAWVTAEVFEQDVPFLAEGQAVTAEADALPGHVPFAGKVRKLGAGPLPDRRSVRVQLEVSDPAGELRPGSLVTARAEAPVMRLAWWRRAAITEWRDATAVELATRALLTPAVPGVPSGVESLLRGAAAEAMRTRGQGLAAPQDAVIDHGRRKLAFVESGPGMFDTVEVTVGPRCGDYYPVLRGLGAGQRVAAAGAFLLDAEMSLNHGLAAAYFGATRAGDAPPAGPAAEKAGALSPADRALAARQKVCPVTGQPLDSMGGPVRVVVAGRTVFVCCEGCEAPLRAAPEKYLPKLPHD